MSANNEELIKRKLSSMTDEDISKIANEAIESVEDNDNFLKQLIAKNK